MIKLMSILILSSILKMMIKKICSFQKVLGLILLMKIIILTTVVEKHNLRVHTYQSLRNIFV